MNAVEPFDALRSPQQLVLTKEIWQASAFVAGARKAVNDGVRAKDRDRGEAKNLRGDLQGALAEITGALICERMPGIARVSHDLIDFAGPVDGVDLLVEDERGRIARLEAKSHLLGREKNFFLINSRARDNSARRKADGYLPVMTAEGGRLALIGRIIPMREAARWGVPPLRLGDAAVGITLEQLCVEYLRLRRRAAETALREAGIACLVEELVASSEAGIRAVVTRRTVPTFDIVGRTESLVASLAELSCSG